MAINKVVYGNSTLMDLTSDTVTPSDVLNSKSFHDASGTLRTGSADISGKADKVSNATSGDLAGLDSNGNLTDTGIAATAISGKIDKVSNPTQGDVPVITSSGGIASSGFTFNALQRKAINPQISIDGHTVSDVEGAIRSLNTYKINESAYANYFSTYDSYAVGDYVLYQDSLYKCIWPHQGSWDATDFTSVKLTEEVKEKIDASKAYSTDDSAETTIDDADYFPFYDTSATAKKKSLWSNIKSVLKTYFDTLYSNKISSPTSGKFVYADSNGVLYSSSYDQYNFGNTADLSYQETQVQFTVSGQTITETMYYQTLAKSSVGTMSTYEEIENTFRLTQTVTLSTSADTTVIFGGQYWPHLASMPVDIIATGKKENVFNITTSISDIGYKSCEVDLTNHICTVVFPSYSSAASMDVSLYMY